MLSDEAEFRSRELTFYSRIMASENVVYLGKKITLARVILRKNKGNDTLYIMASTRTISMPSVEALLKEIFQAESIQHPFLSCLSLQILPL